VPRSCSRSPVAGSREWAPGRAARRTHHSHFTNTRPIKKRANSSSTWSTATSDEAFADGTAQRASCRSASQPCVPGSRARENERKLGRHHFVGLMMLVEIVAASMFGSLALIADGLHMSTHAGAMLIAALAYTYARRMPRQPLRLRHRQAGRSVRIYPVHCPGLVALLIGYEAVVRFFAPVTIEFREAIPIAIAGLAVQCRECVVARRGEHHGHRHDSGGGSGPRSRPRPRPWPDHDHDQVQDHEHGCGQSTSTSTRMNRSPPRSNQGPGQPAQATTRDNSIRSAYVHVLADMFVPFWRSQVCSWPNCTAGCGMDPLAGIIGAVVIANWSVTLIRDTAASCWTYVPMSSPGKLRRTLEVDGDRLSICTCGDWAGHLGRPCHCTRSRVMRRSTGAASASSSASRTLRRGEQGQRL